MGSRTFAVRLATMSVLAVLCFNGGANASGAQESERRFVWVPVRPPEPEPRREVPKDSGAREPAPPLRDETVLLARSTPIVFDRYDAACYSPEELAAVHALDGIPDEDIDALLRSDDAHLIGVGLHLADYRELPEFFLRYPEILRDGRPSPLVRCSNVQYYPGGRGGPPEHRYGSIAQSVAAQYQRYLGEWYGVWAGNERVFHEHISPDADPWLEPDTWRMVFDRAGRIEDPVRRAEARERVRERMLRAPEKVRWLLLAGRPIDHMPGAPRPFFTEEESRAALRELDPALRQAIREGRAPLTPRIERDIANNDEDPEDNRAQYYDRAKRLLD